MMRLNPSAIRPQGETSGPRFRDGEDAVGRGITETRPCVTAIPLRLLIINSQTNSPGAVQQVGVGNFSQTAFVQNHQPLIAAIDAALVSAEFEGVQKTRFIDASIWLNSLQRIFLCVPKTPSHFIER
jgi:hypothetical protein